MYKRQTYPNGFVSVKDVSLYIEDGEFVIFHGPSGCGKSTILRMVGGLEDITSGKIYLGDELLNEILPRDRKLAMAFQNYTLYRHLNVYDNLALGLRLRNLPRTVVDIRVRMTASFCLLYTSALRRACFRIALHLAVQQLDLISDLVLLPPGIEDLGNLSRKILSFACHLTVLYVIDPHFPIFLSLIHIFHRNFLILPDIEDTFPPRGMAGPAYKPQREKNS